MQITVAAIGRERAGPYRSLFDTFVKRCPWPIQLVEIPVSTAATAAQRRHREALKLGKAIAGHERVISLDVSGQLLDSETLAEWLGQWRDEGSKLGVVIGGPDGLDLDALPRIDLALAFGRTTWPHQLVRVMLAEQVYRASTILAGHPYHRG